MSIIKNIINRKLMERNIDINTMPAHQLKREISYIRFNKQDSKLILKSLKRK